MPLGFTAASSQSCTLPSPIAHQSLSGCAVSVWYNASAVAGYILNISTAGSGTTNRWALRALAGGFRISARRDDADIATDLDANPPIPAANTLYHLVGNASYVDGYLELWINGIRRAVANPAGWTTTSDPDVPIATRIGSRADGAANFLTGNIQDLQFFDRVLTPQEINNMWGYGLIQSALHTWRLNDATTGTAGTAVDTGTGGKNATGVNSPVWQASDISIFNIPQRMGGGDFFRNRIVMA